MGLHIRIALGAAMLTAVLVFAAADAGIISNDALLERKHNATGRSLLQAKKDCPVDFKGANYTVVTSWCKDLMYQPSLCCSVLKEFACPYSGYINDPSSSCAGVMFSYISIYGKYPPGLFRSTCMEGESGLKCSDVGAPDVQPAQEDLFSAAGMTAPGAAMALVAGIAAALLWMRW